MRVSVKRQRWLSRVAEARIVRGRRVKLQQMIVGIELHFFERRAEEDQIVGQSVGALALGFSVMRCHFDVDRLTRVSRAIFSTCTVSP